MLPVSLRKPLLAGILATTLASATACQAGFAQSPEGAGSGERLEQFISAERRAVDAGEPAEILKSGRQLGALALGLLGRLYAGQERCALASDAYREALQVDNSPESLQERLQTTLWLLSSELCANRLQSATAVVSEVLKIAGNSAQTYLMIADAYHSADDLPETIQALSHAVELNPELSAAHLALGNAYWELNEYQYNPDTLREFSAAQKLHPEDPFANQSLGFILSQYERFQDAAVYLSKATEEDPTSPDAWLQLGLNAYAENHLAEARASLERAIALTGADVSRNAYQIRRVYPIMSRIEFAEGRIAEAQRFAQQEEMLRSQTQSADVSSPLTESAAIVAASGSKVPEKHAANQRNDPTSQQQELEQRLKVIAASSLNDAGTALARGKEYAEALPLFRVASVANPNLQPVMRNLGLAAFHAGDYKEAAAALAVTLQQNPDDKLVRDDLELARKYARSSKP